MAIPIVYLLEGLHCKPLRQSGQRRFEKCRSLKNLGLSGDVRLQVYRASLNDDAQNPTRVMALGNAFGVMALPSERAGAPSATTSSRGRNQRRGLVLYVGLAITALGFAAKVCCDPLLREPKGPGQKLPV